MKKLICVLMVFAMVSVSGSGARAYNAQAPIRIDSDSGFASYASSGNGTAENPWNITDLDINGTGHGYCIYIGNTTDYFIIEGCYLHDAYIANPDSTYSSNSGIILYNVDNAIIQGNEIVYNDYGVYILGGGENNTVQYNNASSNYYAGIKIDNSNNNDVYRNTADYNWMGIQVVQSDFNVIEDNLAYYNDYALMFDGAEDNTAVKNSFCLSDAYGVYIDDQSSDNRIFQNNFGNNSGQAYDIGTGNDWNSNYSTGGNFWSDDNPSDDYSGENQTLPGSDGFGDSGYNCIGGPSDAYQRVQNVATFGLGQRDDPSGLGQRDDPS